MPRILNKQSLLGNKLYSRRVALFSKSCQLVEHSPIGKKILPMGSAAELPHGSDIPCLVLSNPISFVAWLGAESNRRHVDFQSTALPTELPSRDRRRTARRREVFTMQQCDCRATPKGFRADPQNAANSLRCATWNSSYNRPHEEDHFHE